MSAEDPASKRDIIVIGTSAGGIGALLELVKGLPADLNATVFVVIHQLDTARSTLPEMLSRSGHLPASHALHGQPHEKGHIYIAPPDNHLLIRDGQMQVVRGPRENGHRPAVDPLFRTAASYYGPRVIGVVLTGGLDCGTAGLQSIKAKGGLAVVQDPADAVQPDMPLSALASVEVDHIVGLRDLAALLVRLVAEPVESTGLVKPAGAHGKTISDPAEETPRTSAMTCPICQGSMTEVGEGSLIQFRCHVGHAYSLQGMYADQATDLEAALWAAIRSLEESEALARRVAATSRGTFRNRFEDKAVAMRGHADVIRRMILGGQMLASPDLTLMPSKE